MTFRSAFQPVCFNDVHHAASVRPRDVAALHIQYWEYPQTAGDLPFGTVVQRNVLANLHDHLSGAFLGYVFVVSSMSIVCSLEQTCAASHSAGWKVDLDVLGTQNTFVKQVRS